MFQELRTAFGKTQGQKTHSPEDIILKSSPLVSQAHRTSNDRSNTPHPCRLPVLFFPASGNTPTILPKHLFPSWKNCHTVLLCPVSLPLRCLSTTLLAWQLLEGMVYGPLISSFLGDVHYQTLGPGDRGGKLFCSVYHCTFGFCSICRYYLFQKAKEIKIKIIISREGNVAELEQHTIWNQTCIPVSRHIWLCDYVQMSLPLRVCFFPPPIKGITLLPLKGCCGTVCDVSSEIPSTQQEL